MDPEQWSDWIIPLAAAAVPLTLAALPFISKGARLRKTLEKDIAIQSSLPEGSRAGAGLARANEINAAMLAAITLVRRPWFGEIYVVVCYAAGTAFLLFAYWGSPEDALIWLIPGGILYVFAYVFTFVFIGRASKYRRRQARAILLGRPSGKLPINTAYGPFRMATDMTVSSSWTSRAAVSAAWRKRRRLEKRANARPARRVEVLNLMPEDTRIEIQDGSSTVMILRGSGQKWTFRRSFDENGRSVVWKNTCELHEGEATLHMWTVRSIQRGEESQFSDGEAALTKALSIGRPES